MKHNFDQFKYSSNVKVYFKKIKELCKRLN